VALADDLARIAAAGRLHGEVVAVLAAEPEPGARAYLLAFAGGASGSRGWLVVDQNGSTISARGRVRDAVSIAALCEVAEESAFGGDLDELRSELVALRISERPAGIEEAEEAALALQRTLGSPPQLATPVRLDEIGRATRRLEHALDPAAGSPFAAAMQAAQGAVEELLREVEAGYLVDLE
jgi:hypothetical protein